MTETIQVRYAPVAVGLEPAIGKSYHKYLLYTDRHGRQYGLRAGPSPRRDAGITDLLSPPDDPNEETPFGRVQFQDAPYDEHFVDYPATVDDLSEILAEGEDLSGTWRQLQSAFHDIESLRYNYSPLGVNSNTIIDDTLSFGGVPPTRRDGSAGNEVWENERGRLLDVISTPGLQQLPSTPAETSLAPGQMDYRSPGYPRSGRARIGHDAMRDMAEMNDRDFAAATKGDRWHRIWER